MAQKAIAIAALALVTACGNPLDRFASLDDVALADDAGATSVVAQEQDAPARPGLFSRMFGGGEAQAEDVPAQVDPEEQVAGVDQAAINAALGAAIPVTEPQSVRSGLFGFLRQGSAPAETQIDVAASDAPTEQLAELEPVAPDQSADLPEPVKAGFFSFLRPRAPSAVDASAAEPTLEQNTELAALPETTEPSAPRRGLFSFFSRSAPETDAAPIEPVATGPASKRVTTGTVLPFGQIATNCDVSNRELGKRIGRSSGYSLYDTGGDTERPRTHFITGFPDRCARQFTAALVMFGDVGTYEVVRFGAGRRSTSATDAAYDEIQAAYCGVPKNTPCGNRIEALGRSTTFLTIYERFGTNEDWLDVLVHNGSVVSIQPRSR